ncbi:MAG: hypothetical protein PWP27_926 [Clostridiales bacterium]|nr:hypothetical protein [Clostridiales bacterium]MDK2933116.1 hypothetical protein [Clostridiales bacterium]
MLLLKMCDQIVGQINQKTPKENDLSSGALNTTGAEGGTRTHTMSPSLDFESSASANSTTSA